MAKKIAEERGKRQTKTKNFKAINDQLNKIEEWIEKIKKK